MGPIADDLSSIFENVKEAALTMQKGGGIGHDFSTLRPAGALVKSVGAGASGPVSFMDVWDSMCKTIMSAGQRRGAMMGTMRCDHPDIEAFIDAKSDAKRASGTSISRCWSRTPSWTPSRATTAGR
jgi:ribonucleoside-diphosphate reductase alpha chain